MRHNPKHAHSTIWFTIIRSFGESACASIVTLHKIDQSIAAGFALAEDYVKSGLCQTAFTISREAFAGARQEAREAESVPIEAGRSKNFSGLLEQWREYERTRSCI